MGFWGPKGSGLAAAPKAAKQPSPLPAYLAEGSPWTLVFPCVWREGPQALHSAVCSSR